MKGGKGKGVEESVKERTTGKKRSSNVIASSRGISDQEVERLKEALRQLDGDTKVHGPRNGTWKRDPVV